MGKGKQKRNISLPLVIFGIAILAILVLLLIMATPYIEAERQYEGVTTESAEESSLIDWDYWLAVNPDIIGWIVVPGTIIDYPIVQASKDDPTFYLTHDVYREYNIYGCPYVDAGCDGLEDLTPIIYGHHMINGTMFSNFANMTDPVYAEDHNTVYIHTPNNNTNVLEVAGARVINAASEEKVMQLDNKRAMRTYFVEQLAKCPMKRVEITESADQVFTFVTCSYTMFRNERTLVYGI